MLFISITIGPKMTYRGITVAVKQFKENVHLSLVKHEASVLAKMEHPGNYQYSSQEWQTAVVREQFLCTTFWLSFKVNTFHL